MLQVGKFRPDQHREIAKEIYEFFAEDPNRILLGMFAADSEYNGKSTLDENVAALCIRGARMRLIGLSQREKGDPQEQAFAEFLGYEDADYMALTNNNYPEQMMENLRKKLAA